jgi:DNA repair exonuclease SbcCD nuclease subunit
VVLTQQTTGLLVREIVAIWRADAHLADEPPQSRIDDWTSAVLDKVEQVGTIAKINKASVVLDGGDFFHIKSPIRNSHGLIRRVVNAHRNYPCSVFGTIGNHDVKYGDMKFIDESPLGVLFETGVFNRLYDKYEGMLEGDAFSVRFVGIPYHGTKYDMSRFTNIKKGSEKWLVAVVHCLASPSGGSMYEAEDVIKYADLLDTAPDVYLFGHSHTNQGVMQVGNKWFVNIGSMSRGTISQDDLNRIPECAILRFTETSVTIERKQLEVRPAKEVLDLAGKVKKEAHEMTMEAFVDSLKTSLQMRKETSLLEMVGDLADVPQEVKERAVGYLEKAGAR